MPTETVYVLDADERRDLVRRCLSDRIRLLVCPACGDEMPTHQPLLVYRPSDGGLDALIYVESEWGQRDEGQDGYSASTRLLAWLYGELRLTFSDHRPCYVQTTLDGLCALLCRDVPADAASSHFPEVPEVPEYAALLEHLRDQRRG